MRLHWSPRSPYVRKVSIALHETGLFEQVEIVRTTVSFLTVPTPDVLALNPLGKIPILEVGDGRVICDSSVICAYLDTQHGGSRLVPDGAANLRHLHWNCLGDGILDLLVGWQLSRSDDGRGPFRASAAAKLKAALSALQSDVAELRETPFGLGHIALVAALGHLDFRFADSRWRAAFPQAADWADDMALRPSVAATTPVDEAGTPLGAPKQGLDFLN